MHNFVPVRSIYRSRGGIYGRTEGRVSLHTQRDRVAEIIALARQNHPYEVPGISTRAITDGNPDYLAWIAQETTPDVAPPSVDRELLFPSGCQHVEILSDLPRLTCCILMVLGDSRSIGLMPQIRADRSAILAPGANYGADGPLLMYAGLAVQRRGGRARPIVWDLSGASGFSQLAGGWRPSSRRRSTK